MKNKSVWSILTSCVHILIKTALTMSAIIVSFALFYWYNNNLSIWEARILWPQIPFSSEAFKSGSEQERAQMVVDLMTSQTLLNTRHQEIAQLLGNETGDYYVNDSTFTYRLTNRESANWILTLVPDDTGKIKKVFIRKSCCSVSRNILNSVVEFYDPTIRWILGTYD